MLVWLWILWIGGVCAMGGLCLWCSGFCAVDGLCLWWCCGFCGFGGVVGFVGLVVFVQGVICVGVVVDFVDWWCFCHGWFVFVV